MPATAPPSLSARAFRSAARARSLLALLAASTLWACGGGGDDPPTEPTPGTLALALASTSGSVVAGNQTTVGVTVTRGGSFTGTVTLAVSGAPAGVTAALSATSLAAGASTATLSVQVAASAAAGTYPLTVQASGTGVTTQSATYTLTVTAAPVPTFTLAAAPGAVSVVAGQQGTSTLTVTRDGGFTGAVQLALEGAPTGVTGAFSANPVASGAATSTLTLSVGATATPGTYPLTVRATGTGVTERTATITLTVTAAPTLTLTSATNAVTVTQAQQSAAIAFVLTRAGGVAGNVTMSLENAPAGVTGTFTPNPATGASTQLVLAVGAQVAAGTYNLTVRGSVGAVSGTFPIALTVTAASAGDVAINTVPAAVTVTAGQTGLSTVNIARSGGFTGVVNLTATGAPAGVTATFTPAAAAGTQAQLGLAVATGTAPGTYSIVVRGNATGLAERTTTLTLTVQAPTGGTGNVTWRFCDTDRFPLWVAFQDGTGGGWTRVLPSANQTYSFTMNSSRGGVAYINRESGSNADVAVFYGSREELQQRALAECTTNPAQKTLNGTVAGLSLGQTASVAIGGGSANVFANGPFTVNEVNDGSVDLVAVRSAFNMGTFAVAPDRMILRRDVNYPNNGTIPPIDFDAAESFAPISADITVANAGADQIAFVSGFATERGGFAGNLSIAATGGGTRTLFGVPLARTQSGDLHQLSVVAVGGTTSQRGVFQYNREFTNRTITLGPELTLPTVSSLASAPYPRLRAAGPFQAEYGQEVGVTFSQTAGGGRSWTITATPAWFGATSNYQLDMPDLSTAAGFEATWALAAGVSTTWSVSAGRLENSSSGALTENFRLVQASRSGNVTP